MALALTMWYDKTKLLFDRVELMQLDLIKNWGYRKQELE